MTMYKKLLQYDAEKIKNRGEQNFEDEANNKQLAKEDTQQRNLNSNCL